MIALLVKKQSAISKFLQTNYSSLMKSNWIFLSLVLRALAVVSVSQAQDLSALSCKSRQLITSQANQFLEETQNSYAKITGFKANFLQVSYLKALEVSENSSGQVYFSKPGKLRWVYKNPHPQVFVSDGKTIWFYQEEERQVVIDRASGFFDSGLPVSFILGVGDIRKQFKLNFACKNDLGTLFDLIPAKDDNGLLRFRLLVDPQHFPIAAEITDGAENRSSFLFTDVDLNPDLAATLFKFEATNGIDVIDRRSDQG